MNRNDGAVGDARKRLEESITRLEERDDRLICCPECTSVFEAEDHTLAPSDWLARVIADAKAEVLRGAAREWAVGPDYKDRKSAVAKWLRDRAEAIR